MPLTVDKKIGSNSRLMLWNVTESTDSLLSMLDCDTDPKLINVNEQLRKQRICARILINQMSPKPNNEISYDEFNKPFLIGATSKISISHTLDRVAVILNSNNETGVDIESIKPQIERISTRFMSETELQNINSHKRLEHLTTFWCAKETMYKYYGKKELLFRENILIDPFSFNEQGIIWGHIRTAHINIDLPLCYEKTGDHMLVYVND